MREKLIGLIIASGQVSGFAGALADYLLANGVTIPTRCKDCKKEWCYLRQELGENGYCSAGERENND